DAFARHLHAHHVGRRRLQLSGDGFLRQVQTMAVVAEWLLIRALLRAQGVEPLGAAETAKGMALGQQFISVLLIDIAALALTIRAVRTTDIRPLIPLQSQPAQ